ncbi:uncharacterized protein LOC128159314 [Crassostrea angulata]|uniref:uncharacterized protein LOC128159314 n=1 Tax=Magallana angulata TaxID=2784310 RepID=UPI0022B13DA2|nr:uncharacterized protein LOC128159314 [Crassostrea angulata]
MPKRKTFDGRKQREKQKMRMREKRQQSRYPDTPPNELVVESSVSVEPLDGAISAPPSNFQGQVSMGFPNSKKPLARVQASLRERMHSPASRLPSPRGSRLFVREQDKAPSPDSPAWVCAPPRAPGLDTVHVSGPAGQAQLDTSREEETSSILKDEETLTRNKTDTERKTKRILNEHKILETIYENQNNDISEEIYDEISKNIYDEISESIIENQCIKISENMYDSHNEISKNLNENEESEVTENMNEKRVTAIHVNLYENQQTRTMKDINGKIENENDLEKNIKREKYNQNPVLRNRKLAAAALKYREDKYYQSFVKERYKEKYRSDTKCRERSKKLYDKNRDVKREISTEKYRRNTSHREDVKLRSKEKYRTDPVHKEEMKKRSTVKYQTNAKHREEMKKRSIIKYQSDEKHREEMKKRSIIKYQSDEKHRENVKIRSKQIYNSDEAHKKRVNSASIRRYNTDESYRKRNLRKRSMKYETDDGFRTRAKVYSKEMYASSSNVRLKKKDALIQQRRAKRQKLDNEEEVAALFRCKVKEGINYICCCCNRLLFENQVQRCNPPSYEKNTEGASAAEVCIQTKYLHQCSEFCLPNCTRSSLWICFTCHRKILKGKIPAEATVNNLILEDIPKELSNLNSLERHLIALQIPFMKVMGLPHGGQKNVHGPVVCVPSDMKKVANLPLKEDENLLLRVKLKRKLNYKGYFEYQFVDPKHVFAALDYLKQNNKWYASVTIDKNWKENDFGEEVTEVTDEVQLDDVEHQELATDTCLQPLDIAQEVLDHFFDDIYSIAPGEGKNPVRMLQEPGNEAKSFPYLFPSGKFSWNDDRPERITLSRYFNNRLMNADNRFAKDTSYIFFSQYLSELNQVIEKTQISIRKSVTKIGSDKLVTPDMLQDPETLSKLLRNDEALRFMQPIRGTPAYWSAAQKDLFAMLRQLGIPTWFCSFSAAEHRWNDSIRTILQQQNDHRDPDLLDWSEKNEVLKSNPVTVARMFEQRFHVFQKDVILSPSEPIGKVIDFFQRVEFQQRGSPHMHCLYWVENSPKIDQDGEEAVCNFVDKYVSCAVPLEEEDAELRSIVLAVQQHSKKHSKSCRKKGSECRFNFPRPPSVRTFITSPETDEIDQNIETETKNETEKRVAKDMLMRVWDEMQLDSNSSSTVGEIFNALGLTQEQYETAYNIITKKKAIVLQREPCELWTNQYNPCLLRCWDANMDIQFVLDPFSCIVYIISYISKSEREMGMLLKQTKIEAEEGNCEARQTLKKIGSAYLKHREVSAQEAVYRVCNLKMKECSRKVVFIPVGENPTRLTKPLSQIKRATHKEREEANDDGNEEEDLWMTNIVERYENRPNKIMFHDMCLAQFCSEYRVLAKSQVPKTPNENVFELQNSKGFVQKRTRTKPAVIRYPRFSVDKMSEKYYQCLLQLFLPHETTTQLKPTGFDLYQTFYENGHVKVRNDKTLQAVKILVDTNHAKFAENEEMIADAQETFETIGEPQDAWASLCPETELIRKECIEERSTLNVLDDHVDEIPEMETEANSADVMFKVQQNNQSREEALQIIQNLNETQRNIFYYIRDWCIEKSTGQNPDPFHIFITGGAGTGKSHVIKAIHYESSRLLAKNLSTPDSLSVLLSAFTGTAAFNIGGNTIHHLFALPKYMRLPYEPLKEQILSEIRVQLRDLSVLVIDEVSMVYKRLLYYIHERLVQIKKSKKPFGGVSVIAVGDFYQLPPVKQRKDERLYKSNISYPVDHWQELFKVVELTEIMRQKQDVPFAEILNSLRTRELREPLKTDTLSMLHECVREGPEDVLHVYATNDEVNNFNLKMLRKSCKEFVEIDARDFEKDTATGKLTLRRKPISRSKTDGLSSSLLIAVNARVMLTRNCNVEDGLVNGVMGNISNFILKDGNVDHVLAVGVIFDNKNVGKHTGRKTSQGNVVLIERVQEEVVEKKSKSYVRHQFPLRLSWACTAHKVQGMTVDKVVVNLDRTFSAGQGYVALTRVRSKDGLFIETDDVKTLEKKMDFLSTLKLEEMHTMISLQICKTKVLERVAVLLCISKAMDMIIKLILFL